MGNMRFILKKDKVVWGIRNTMLSYIEAGEYDVVRLFDKDRVLVNLAYSNPGQLTILNLKDGVLRM